MNKSAQRQSAREKPPVNYSHMAHGTGESRSEFGDLGGRAVQKKITNPKDVKQKVQELFGLLNCHPSVQLFMEPLE